MSLNTKEYYNRDLSWLRFNHRVLQEAADKRNPLYERIKFLAIFSSNLDEFFKVRVSDIRKIKQLDKPLRKRLITKPNKLLKEIKKQVDSQQKEFGRIFFDEIIPALESEDIHLLPYKEFNKEQQKFSETYYKEKIQPSQSLSISENKPFIENEALYLVAQMVDNSLIWVKINEDTPRFIELPSTDNKHYITFVDDIIKHNLNAYYKLDFYSIKISRDAELYIENEYSGNLLDKIKNALPNRVSGQVTRALFDELIPEKLQLKINEALDINDTDIIKGGTYHNFKDFFGFPNPTSKNLSFVDLPPLHNKAFDDYTSIFSAIKSKDRLLHFPYQSYQPVIQLIEEASTDVNVTKIKITLYRVSKDSLVANALLKAAKNGKDVFVFIETKARFDEENNIKWGKVLEENGANVVYSYPGIKVHSKILYIERNEENKSRVYGYISTGNFNEKTSKIYTDYGLMTSNSKITKELKQVFQVLERDIIIPKSKRLLISPFTTRSTFRELIEVEIENAKAGKDAYIILKLNSLQDAKMIKLLYKASNAGVKIRLFIRGICCLIPGVEGQSENIYITSIVDRFLEHGRLYIFGNNGEEKMYLGSADWMTRNLDHRIEVITPVLDRDIHLKLKELLDLQLNDTTKSRIIDCDQINNYVEKGSLKESSQHTIYKTLL
ncbi:polyphosphate kinase 1 [Winogradskyella immobilis]|uniref:Polyphosphate kinase n=1 Tax=Winogradskyella immobilis TaxID=2816852 RepID=A0ABS8EJG0_9FLAO|nr:polyphosphate kinase 1 [Winogradskyella immobilis]MCC1483171.1 polyphosphate kinase 1 [Winogradskyella immobilis]MCG0015266.1 polyphosphate kinase 1 [Winogradskyella immobilis]